ncbi:MAG: FlgO family outer membrane protein [Bdellovibrionota bacterium]
MDRSKQAVKTAEKTAKRSAVSYLILAFLSIVLGVTSCSKRYQDLPAFSAFPIRDVENQSVGRFKTSYLADQIHAYFRGNANGPIAVTTFVDIDNLYESSTFGRLLAEQMMTELTMRGYNVIELRQAEAMQIMFDRGEFSLSRDIATLKKNQDISAIVVGTYTASPLRVYLNARLIDPSTSMVASVGSVEMTRTPEISKLLRTNSFPPTLERIPVRHLGYGRVPAPHYWPYAYGPTWAPDPQGFSGDNEQDSPPILQPKPQLAPGLPPPAHPEALNPHPTALEPTS